MVNRLERVNEAMAAGMPRSNVNVQPLPAHPDLQHCHVAHHIATNWLAGGCSLAHIVLFFGGFSNFFLHFLYFW